MAIKNSLHVRFCGFGLASLTFESGRPHMQHFGGFKIPLLLKPKSEHFQLVTYKPNTFPHFIPKKTVYWFCCFQLFTLIHLIFLTSVTCQKSTLLHTTPKKFPAPPNHNIYVHEFSHGDFLLGGKKLSGFHPGHKIDKTRVKSARNGQKVRKTRRNDCETFL